MPPALLRGFARDWEIRVPVVFDDGYACNGLFLDIVPEAGAVLNGVLIPVTEEEAEMLSLREAQYDTLDVTRLVQAPVSPGIKVVVFSGRTEYRRDSPGVQSFRPRSYRELVEAAALTRGAEFLEQFHATTHQITGREYEGGYRFADPHQELAARPVIR